MPLSSCAPQPATCPLCDLSAFWVHSSRGRTAAAAYGIVCAQLLQHAHAVCMSAMPGAFWPSGAAPTTRPQSLRRFAPLYMFMQLTPFEIESIGQRPMTPPTPASLRSSLQDARDPP